MTQSGEPISNLIGKQVRLGHGGPDERRGVLESIQDDYLTLRDGKERVHCPFHHLKSITALEDTAEETGRDLAAAEDLMTPLPDTFMKLLFSCVGHKVALNEKGPESATGFVFAVRPDIVQVVTGPDELMNCSVLHVRNLRVINPRRTAACSHRSRHSSHSGHATTGHGRHHTSGHAHQSGANPARYTTTGGTEYLVFPR